MSYPFRALVLAVVSKPSQAAPDRYSIPDQLAGGRAFCESREWPIVAEIVIPGHSRKYLWLADLVADCPEFAELVALMQSGSIDVIVVREQSRLWRTKELQEQLSALRRLYRVQIVDYNNPRDPVPPDKLKFKAIDKFLDSVGGFTAEQESETFQIRIHGILQGRIARGLSNAALPPFGYVRVDGDSPFVLTEAGRYWLRWMRDRRCELWPWRRIGRELDARGIRTTRGRAWSATTVAFVLRNEFYRGKVHWGEANGVGNHERPWSEAECQELERVNAFLQRPHRQASQHEFSLLCRCGFCGSLMTYGRGVADLPYLVCGTYSHLGNEACQRNAHYESDLRSYVVRNVQEWLRNPAAWLENRQKEIGEVTPGEIQVLDRQLADQEARWRRWDGLFEQGGISGDELRLHRERILGAIGQLRKEREALQRRAEQSQGLQEEIEELSNIVDDLPRLDPLDRRRIYIRLIRRIWLHRGQEPRIERL